MTKREMIDNIIDREWVMFHNVNGDDRTECQDDRGTFDIMRRGQYEAWSEKTLECFMGDITAAENEGRNLSREKYIRMMKVTDPDTYGLFSAELPEMSDEKERLIAELWERFLAQTVKMRDKYPLLALGGRPLLASEEIPGWTSLETYQKGELTTYSEETLRSLAADFDEASAKGIDLVYEIQKNSVTGLGYKDMDAAEAAMGEQIKRIVQENTRCCCCGDEE